MGLQELGIHGKQRATKKAQVIRATQIDIGGFIGKAQRQYNRTFAITNMGQFATIFGEQLASHYLQDAVQGAYDQTQFTGYIKSHLGNTGSAIDAVIASSIVKDQSAANTLKLEFAYQNDLCYGIYGNQFGRQITLGSRYSTTLAAALIPAAVKAQLSAIGDIKVGDVLKFTVTGVPGTTHHKITSISEATGEVFFTGPFHATFTGVIGDTVEVIGIRIQKFRKDKNGVVGELESELGKVFCSLEPEVTDYYIENVHNASSEYMKITDQASASVLNLSYPVSDSAVVYLGQVTANGDVSGENGTAPTTVAHWSFNHAAFDNDPITIIVNPETTDKDYFNALETYLKNRVRTDFPVCLPTIQKGLSKSSLITVGRSYQSSVAKLMANVGNWLEKTDQFASSPLAPKRQIPNVGHVLGAWLWTIQNQGIHEVPANDQVVLNGCSGVVNNPQYSDRDRTDIADAGMNTIMAIPGSGIQIRNFFTASTAPEYMHGNVLIMLKYVRESIKESVKGDENRPNVLTKLKSNETAIFKFMWNLWVRGSTRKVALGETFGQFENDDKSPSEFAQHVEIIADASNNPRDTLFQGNRNLEIGMSAPTPTGSIDVWAGMLA